MGKAKAPSAKKAAKEGLVKKNGDLEDTFKAVLGEIFRRFDKDGDGALCEAELEEFATTSGSGKNVAEDRAQLQSYFDCNSKGDLTYKGFEQMYTMQIGHEAETTWKDLEQLGYKKPLALLDPEAASAEALAKAKMDELRNALTDLKLAPSAPKAHRRAGDALQALGRTEAAQREYAQAEALEKAPSTVDDQD